MKACYRCGKSKRLSEFYKNSKMADGHFNKCKPCYCEDVRANRKRRVNYYRAYDRARFHDDPDRRASSFAHSSKWIRLWPKRRRAHQAVNNAVRDGRLAKLPCEVCGDPRSHGHHDDYSKPLDVKWLCPVHHAARHRELAGKGSD